MKVARTLLLAILLSFCSASWATADSPAEMLEKGIYNEDTIGNLDEAIKIYRKVVTAAGETEALAAKAQYRLGQCLLKQGKKDEAIVAFETVVKKYPDQTDIVAQAKKQLPSDLILNSTPWKDGERLTMQMKLAGGQNIGLIGVGVNSAKINGEDVWEMTIRRFVDGGNNEGVSKVWVDKESFRPRHTVFDHTVLGFATGEWTDEKLVVTQRNPGKEKKETEVELDGVTYSNDQVFYGLRQLPLKVGYEVTVPIRVAFTGGNDLGLEITVESKEKVETPAGTFDCFKLDTNIHQTFWIADVPERYMVQFEVSGVTAKLNSISYSDAAEQFEDKKLGFACTIPKGWFHVSKYNENETAGGVQMVAPDMTSAMVFMKDKTQLKDNEQESLEAWMDAKVERMKGALKKFELGPKGIEKTKLGSLDALAISTSSKMAKRDVDMGLTLAKGDKLAVQLMTNSAKAKSEAAQKQFDEIRSSFKLR